MACLLALAGATTAPSTAPAVDPVLARWFAQLADPDGDVRDAARESLMGRSGPDDLARLLAVVRAAPAPLRPDQACLLHEVVCHDFLAGEPYVVLGDSDDPNGMGAREYVMGVGSDGPVDPDEPEVPRLGVRVGQRWPGFPARRFLRPGDMILGVTNGDGVPDGIAPTPTWAALINAVHAEAGLTHRVTLTVLRDGREVAVTVTLVPRPADAGPGGLQPRLVGRPRLGSMDQFVQGRQTRAEAYWRETFAPWVGVADDPLPAAGPDPLPLP